MDVRIGVTYSAKELEVELADSDRDQVIKDVDGALEGGGGGGKMLWLTDRRGRRIGVPVDKIAYIEIGTPDEERRVGFGL